MPPKRSTVRMTPSDVDSSLGVRDAQDEVGAALLLRAPRLARRAARARGRAVGAAPSARRRRRRAAAAPGGRGLGAPAARPPGAPAARVGGDVLGRTPLLAARRSVRAGREGRRRWSSAAVAEHDDERRRARRASAAGRPGTSTQRRGRRGAGCSSVAGKPSATLVLEARGEAGAHLRRGRADVVDEVVELAQVGVDGLAGERALERVELAGLLGAQGFTLAHGRPFSAW